MVDLRSTPLPISPIMVPRPLEGKLALITGASRGIGAAIAQNLASKGASIILNYTSESSASQTTTLGRDIKARHHVHCLPVKADIGHPEGPALLVSTARDHFLPLQNGTFQIDIVVNNAGVVNNAKIADITISDYQWMYRINVLGPLLLIQAAIPYLPHDRSGRIINLSSISSTEGFIGQSIYGGTKAALEAMTRTWARELAEQCTVNAINPGPAKTDMWDSMPMAHRGGLKPWTSHSPLAAVREDVDEKELLDTAELVGGRPAYPNEIAGVVGMLCLVDGGWCTGQVVSANGGMRMAI